MRKWYVIHEFSVYGGYTTTLYLKRNMAGGEKKRVSEIERERGQVQQMKLEPMTFSDEPASGELQHKELSKQENPIVGEEVEMKRVVINSHESKVITLLDRILKTPNFFEFSVYERKALGKGKRNEILTHSLYVIKNTVSPEEMTLSYNGTETAPFSEGAWILNTDMDIDSYYNYDGNNDGEFSREDILDNPASILYGGEW